MSILRVTLFAALGASVTHSFVPTTSRFTTRCAHARSPVVVRSTEGPGVAEPVSPETPQAPPAAPKTGKVQSKGIFAPLVRGAKSVMGETELNQLRAKVIAEHTKVITAFVDTSDSKFGRITLKALFEAADKDGNGTLDKAEIREALVALGFEWIDENKAGQLVSKADINDDDVIDFEEFATMAPKTLRTNLVKLAKKNGHDLGFLA